MNGCVDTDGDTICNDQEITDGTDPNNPCSHVGGVYPIGGDCDGDGNPNDTTHTSQFQLPLMMSCL